MPPADPATLSAALATVRELGFAGASLDDLSAMCRWTDAVVLLARELVRMIDAGELVRVRGALKWEPFDTIEGEYGGDPMANWEVSFYSGVWQWTVETMNEIGEGESDSLKDGKAKANEWYRARLAAALEPLIAKWQP